MTVGGLIRAMIAFAICFPALALATYLIAFESYPMGSGRSSLAFAFILLFPPGWTALIFINLRDQEGLAWNQQFAASVVAIIVLQILTLIWTIPFGGVRLPSAGQSPVSLTELVVVFIGLAWLVPMYGATWYAMLRLPHPLGAAPAN